MDSNYYTILGVATTASLEEITTAFRQQALRWHPDHHPPEDQARAHRRFKEVVQAREILFDPATRAEHDRRLSAWRESLAKQSRGYASTAPPAPSPDFQRAERESAQRAEHFASDFDAFMQWLHSAASAVSAHVKENKKEYSTVAGAATGAVVGGVLLGAVFPPAAIVGARLGAWLGNEASKEKKPETEEQKRKREKEERRDMYCGCGCLLFFVVVVIILLVLMLDQ